MGLYNLKIRKQSLYPIKNDWCYRNEKISGDRDAFEHVYITQDGSLRLENVGPEDEGKYVCHAENQHGKVNAASSLTVHCE